MSNVNGHFQNGGELTPTLQSRRELAQELLKKNSGKEDGGGVRPKRSCTVFIPLPCYLVTVAHYCVM